MLKRIKLDAKLSVILIAALLLFVTGFFTLSAYLHTNERLEKDVLTQLHSISKTLSLNINGDYHQYITGKYLDKDGIKKQDSDSLYSKIYTQLNATKELNGLSTEIYTLFLDSSNQAEIPDVYMGVISGKEQYFRHEYATPPKKLLTDFSNGGKIGRYNDDHGSWLSAFSPILNSKNEVVGVVQVDENFDTFLDQAKAEAWENIFFSLIFIAIVSAVLSYVLMHLVKIDKEKNDQLKETFDLIKNQNKKIFASINYAQNIQDSIIPKSKDLSEVFPESFIYYKAKDVVSGDAPWLCKDKNKVYFAAIDCTGHGVPGALLSFIAYFLLREIIGQDSNLPPGQILEQLHAGVVKTLNQQNNSKNNHDGMDVSLCVFDTENKKMSYAGAHRPLYILSNKKLTEIKGTRRGIGGTHYDRLKKQFETTEIDLLKGDELYICSDGFVDQMGGEEGRKFGSKRLKQYLIDKSTSKPMSDLKTDLHEQFTNWKGDSDQIDDILVMGVRV